MKNLLVCSLLAVAAARLVTVLAVKCDATHECPTGNTCCMTASGWGCCPMPQAVCCEDRVHCCPNGYTCHVSSGECQKGSVFLPWLRKTSTTAVGGASKAHVDSSSSSSSLVWRSEKVESVKCDATHECPTGNTCCRTASGWGCCPLPQAVCCQDQVHCCPNGYKCHTSTSQCQKGSITLPWLQKRPAIMNTPLQLEVESVKCDATHECLTGSTCCRTASGWGCCPLPQAVCCQDQVHCCPNGYKCHTSTSQCQKGSITLPWLQKRPAIMNAPLQSEVESVKCDATHECSTGSTCCRTASGWGCCPLPQAVCCQDQVHCCPNGYKCHTSTGQCQKGSITLPWLQKRPAIMNAPLQSEVVSVKCDATYECSTGSTCCMTASGWGCCPLPQAVCCQDQVHCCPNGYKCHTSTSQCQKGSITLPWLQKRPALFRP